MADQNVVGEIVATERLNNSVNGNPRYSVAVLTQIDGITTVQHYVTDSDISDAYEMGNRGYRPGCKVRFTLTCAGRIANMNTLESVPS